MFYEGEIKQIFYYKITRQFIVRVELIIQREDVTATFNFVLVFTIAV